MKLLIKFPTRGRVDRFFNVLDRYYAFLDDEDNTEFCISIDIDDKTMNNQKVIDRLSTYKNLKYYVGNNKNKIEAVNADIDKCQFDIVLLASDVYENIEVAMKEEGNTNIWKLVNRPELFVKKRKYGFRYGEKK